jgi:hypothetical protein
MEGATKVCIEHPSYHLTCVAWQCMIWLCDTDFVVGLLPSNSVQTQPCCCPVSSSLILHFVSVHPSATVITLTHPSLTLLVFHSCYHYIDQLLVNLFLSLCSCVHPSLLFSFPFSLSIKSPFKSFGPTSWGRHDRTSFTYIAVMKLSNWTLQSLSGKLGKICDAYIQIVSGITSHILA